LIPRAIIIPVFGLLFLSISLVPAHGIGHLNVGAFGNYSIPVNGFNLGDRSGFSGGGKVGLWTGNAGIDLSWSQAQFATSTEGKTKVIESHLASVYFTSARISHFTMETVRTAPFVLVGGGFYSPQDEDKRMGAHVGGKVVHFLNSPKPKPHTFSVPVALDVTALYHAFPSEARWAGFFELRAGINVLIFR
jgi:hypothetical protein